MKYYRFLFIVLATFFLSLNFAYSVDSCCYTGSTIQSSIGPNCPPGNTRVGDVSGSGSCSLFLAKRSTCIEKSSNNCIASVDSKPIFDISILKTNIFDSICQSYTLGSTCSGSGSEATGGNGSGTGSGGNGNSTILPNPTNSTIPPSQIKNLSSCHNGGVGGSFGFFLNKTTCEQTKDSGNDFCLYNPNLGGFLGSYFSFQNLKTLNLPSIEDSCISKTLVKSCFDYKTANNCNNNRANIADSCGWIASSNYLSDSLNKKSGICISNYISSNKNFNKDKYGKGTNLIKNPSFEKSTSFWNSLITTNLITSTISFNSNHYYLLDTMPISQNISNIISESSYLSSFYILYNSSFLLSSLNVKLKIYDKTGNLINTTNMILTYDPNYNLLNNTFVKVNLNIFISPKKSKKISIILNTLNSKIGIDAISFENEQTVVGPTSIQTIFKPVEIIPAAASNCNLCFEDLNFNTCTAKKSNLSGDCSYMVSDNSNSYDFNNNIALSNYFGKNANLNMYSKSNLGVIDTNLIWKSQSIANSKLFCGLYLSQSQCTDPNNYINKNFKSLNSFSGASLCKWNSAAGCFKDSNNDNIQDTNTKNPPSLETNLPQDIRAYLKLLNPISSSFDKYTFQKDCDSIPPNSYIYLTGKKRSGSQITITKNSVGIIGNLKINYDISDMNLESCSGYNITKKIYLDIEVNNNSMVKSYTSSQIKNSFLFKDFFSNVVEYVDPTGNIKNLNNDISKIFNSNSNNISIRAIDQSGNIGKEFNFKFENLDLIGPKINLTSDNTVLNSGIYELNPMGPYGKGKVFNFTIKDNTNYNCNLNLNPLKTSVPSNYYNSTFNFNNTVLINNVYTFNLSKFIFNSTGFSNKYNLTLSCWDIFNQKTSKSFKFGVDYNTNLVILNPLIYSGDSSSSTGYLNGLTPFNAISTSYHIGSCNFTNFLDLNSSIKNNVDYLSAGFNNSNYPTTTFYTNITGNLSFVADGFKAGNIKCSDNTISGNFYEKNLTYIYDTKNPLLINYSLENILRLDNTNTTYFNGSNYFTILSGNEVKLNLNFNGTGSWVKPFQIFNFSALNNSRIISEAQNLHYTSNLFSINNSTFFSSIKLSNFEPSTLIYGNGIKTNDSNLFIKKFSFNFSDSANNLNSTLIQYYSDLSIPSFNFSGDIASQNDFTKQIFTKNLNPKINVKFNSPNYRKFSCAVKLILNPSTSFTKNFNPTNNLSFRLTDFTTGINLEFSHVKFNFNCKDVYNKPLNKTYSLIYDNTAPILDSINLNGETPKFIRIYSGNNQNFNDYIDKLVFTLENTNEVSYNCFYNISESSTPLVYSCNTSQNNIAFNNAGPQLTNYLNLLSGNSSGNLCIRNSNFAVQKAISISTNKTLNTNLKVLGYCSDNVGLKSQVKTLTIPIIYSSKDLVSLKFANHLNKSYATVKSYFPFNTIKISNQNSIPTGNLLETITNRIGPISSIYTFQSQSGFDTSNFNEGIHTLYAIAMDGSFVSGNLVVDRTAPISSLIIPDNFLGNVYSKNFWINMNSFDLGSGLQKIELLVNNHIIFTFNGINKTYDNSSLNLSLIPYYFSNINQNFNGKVKFKNAIVNKTYTFKLNSYDVSGNKNSVSLNVTIKDGIGINLENSKNSIVGVNKITWLTKNNAPIIKFRTSKVVDKCTIYPIHGLNSLTRTLSISNTKQFSFDLSTIVGFDLNIFSTKTDTIRIDCNIGTTHYKYNRDLSLINFIPDYVINSSEGFVLNEAPYLTNISLKSVGPFKDISCFYSIDNSVYAPFGSGIAKSFKQKIDFSNYDSGVHNLNIKCSDLLNTKGPIKTYPFSISKNAPLKISSLKIINSNKYISIPKNNIIYVNNLNNLNLEFNLNKKIGVECTYTIDSNNNIVSSIISFFKSLFNMGQKTIQTNQNPYSFKISPIQISNNQQFTITCSKSGNSDLIQTYRVKLLNTPTNNITSWI